MSTDTNHVLAVIDGAIEDWEESEDAARWHADGGPDELAKPPGSAAGSPFLPSALVVGPDGVYTFIGGGGASAEGTHTPGASGGPGGGGHAGGAGTAAGALE